MSITRRELLLNLLMLTASLVAIGVLFEVGVRTLAPQTVLTLKGLYISDSEVGFRHRPGFVGHERNPEYDTLVFIDERGYRVPAEAPKPALPTPTASSASATRSRSAAASKPRRSTSNGSKICSATQVHQDAPSRSSTPEPVGWASAMRLAF